MECSFHSWSCIYRSKYSYIECVVENVSSTPLLLRIRNIARLVVRDASGGDHSFTRDAVELRPGGVKETIRLRGPGDLLVISSSATFLRDSQVCQSTNPAASPYIISAIVYVTVL